jgi:hypothetical protein
MLVSNCCSATPTPIDNRGADTSDIGICSKCLDHCSYEDDEEPVRPTTNADWNELSNSFFNAGV